MAGLPSARSSARAMPSQPAASSSMASSGIDQGNCRQEFGTTVLDPGGFLGNVVLRALAIIPPLRFCTKMSSRHRLWRGLDQTGTVFAHGKFSPNYLNYKPSFVF